jgi:hypothetical protein
MLLMLPALIRSDSVSGNSAAIGFLVAQWIAVLANYSFSVVTPRTLKQQFTGRGQQLLRSIFAYQSALLLFSGLGLLAFIPKDLISRTYAFVGLLIGFSSVLQWQWFHIARISILPQALLLIVSRILLLGIEAIVLTDHWPKSISPILLSISLAALVVLPIWPTWCVVRVVSVVGTDKTRFLGFRLLSQEMVRGRDLFLAGLLSIVYILGPASLVASFQPAGLVAIQQFDRLRISLSNFSGMLLSTLYPLLLRHGREQLIERFSKTQYLVLPALLSVSGLLLLSFWLPNKTPPILESLHLTWLALSLALACAVAASASNVITLTFLHLLGNDRLYRSVILAGALLFALATIIGLALTPKDLTVLVMIAAGLAELLILSGLWLIARHLGQNKTTS